VVDFDGEFGHVACMRCLERMIGATRAEVVELLRYTPGSIADVQGNVEQ
jgi:hypothetical protein